MPSAALGLARKKQPSELMEDIFEMSELPTGPLPLLITPRRETSRSEFVDALRADAEELRARMTKAGGLLFRGFPCAGADDFADAVSALGAGPSLPYIGGDSPRTHIKGPVYTSTEAPPGVKIPPSQRAFLHEAISEAHLLLLRRGSEGARSDDSWATLAASTNPWTPKSGAGSWRRGSVTFPATSERVA